jgi:hypothetical protein
MPTSGLVEPVQFGEQPCGEVGKCVQLQHQLGAPGADRGIGQADHQPEGFCVECSGYLEVDNAVSFGPVIRMAVHPWLPA